MIELRETDVGAFTGRGVCKPVRGFPGRGGAILRSERAGPPLCGRATRSAEGATKIRVQPHEPRYRDTTQKSKASTTVRGANARW
jgi:hypothetical protein